MSLMLIIVFHMIILAGAVTFRNPGEINHSENSNNISNSRISDSYNHSPASPRNLGQVGFNDPADLGFADATAHSGTLARCPAIVHHDLILDHV
jgi:hypothetical protein